jgi:hypothetical protein
VTGNFPESYGSDKWWAPASGVLDAYQDFLALWKDADPDTPIL